MHDKKLIYRWQTARRLCACTDICWNNIGRIRLSGSLNVTGLN